MVMVPFCQLFPSQMTASRCANIRGVCRFFSFIDIWGRNLGKFHKVLIVLLGWGNPVPSNWRARVTSFNS